MASAEKKSKKQPIPLWVRGSLAVYALLMYALQPFLRRKLARRGQLEPGYLCAIEERFGVYTTPCPAKKGAPTDAAFTLVWVHAVSLGETRAAASLIAALRQQIPQMRLLLTHGTATGRQEGLGLLQAGDIQVWQPFDTPKAVQRFLDYFEPQIGILMETEVWPNWVAACQKKAIPLVLANARLSQKSLRQAQRLAWLAKFAFQNLTAVWPQTQADAERFQQLGISAPVVLGNLKFDLTPNVQQYEAGKFWQHNSVKPIIMFASSREGEEALLLDVLLNQQQQQETASKKRATPPENSEMLHPSDNAAPSAVIEATPTETSPMPVPMPVQWLIVPRHPQRFDAIDALCQAKGFSVSRRSAWDAALVPNTLSMPAAKAREADIWLGDSIGEMAWYYAMSDVALLGGSFAPLGGQNLIEAAACGCPIVMGDATFNFAQAASLAEQAGIAKRVSSMQQAVDVALDWVANPAQRDAASQAALHFSKAHQGAAQRTAIAVRHMLDSTDVR